MASMIDIRRSCMQDNAPVPIEYQAVPFVRGLGNTTIIDTGVAGDNDDLRFKFCFAPEYFANYGSFFGNYDGESVNCWRVIYATINSRFYATRNRITNSSTSLTFTDSVLNKKVFCDISVNNVSMSVYGNRVSNTQEKQDGTHNNKNIAIGANQVITNGNVNDRPTRWYYFRIWDDGVLIRNYVPCFRKSDGVGGFWESVNRQFVRSVGRDDFVPPQ